MIATVNLYSDKKGELNRFLSSFYNTNFDIENSLKWEKEYKNPVELAEIIGVSTGLIGAIEAERLQGVSVPVLWNISQVLGVPINKFFEEQKELVGVK